VATGDASSNTAGYKKWLLNFFKNVKAQKRGKAIARPLFERFLVIN